ncbi:TadE/TadG family type IV pilus assembly protein [Brenneria sp. g21c3]|uniref:TadE/TadG family type IV pilus assembly protein n=1 Tax=Brenneria sp. g21c3 TaxID=3093893 RepID=UPI002ECF7A0E|nr:TadE/TadG family type IV pilus assembly protein [Brenneria sp. g21c3]
MNVLKRFLLILQRDQRGAVTLTYLLCFPVILLALLGSIDFIRYSMAQSKLQNALDTAVISAGRNLDTYTPVPTGSDEETSWRADAISYFFSNMPQGFLGSSVAKDKVIIKYDLETDESGNATGGQLVSMSATGTLPLLVTGMIDRTAFNLSAQNEAVRRTRSDIEMVLALDNSGSMDDPSGVDYKTRMDVLKSSSKTLVNTLFTAANKQVAGVPQNTVDIGLVPFTGTVKIGDKEQALKWLNADWVKNPSQKDRIRITEDYLQNIWSGCIAEPGGNWSQDNPMPAAALTPDAGFQPLFLTYSYNYEPFASSSGKTLKRLSSFSGSKILWAEQNDNAIRVNLAVESNYCKQPAEKTKAPAIFLSANKEVIDSAIDSMSSYGDTGVPVGLLWAWRMITPAWRGEQGWGDVVRPRNPNPDRLNKVIVLLSDGENRPVVRGYPEGLNDKNISKPPVYLSYSEEFTLTYDYQEQGGMQTRSETIHPTVTVKDKGTVKDVYDSIIPFRQCPIDALKMYDPREITQFSSLQTDCNDTDTRTDIGYHTDYIDRYMEPVVEKRERGKLSTSAYDGFINALCQNVKNDGNGIRIYTVTLGNDVGSQGTQVMSNCASGVDFYFNASNVSSLPAVFAAIAGSLTELRLTE